MGANRTDNANSVADFAVNLVDHYLGSVDRLIANFVGPQVRHAS